MKPIAILFSVLLTSLPAILFSQDNPAILKFQQGQTLAAELTLKSKITQEAMGQAIDFTADGSAIHSYKVTNATDDNTTLRHRVQSLTFNYYAMGQKGSYDSQNETDRNGEFGKPMKEMLDKTFDIIIDPTGKVLMARPEKVEATKMDDRMAIITSMLKDVMDIVQPPTKGSASFFKILPEKGVFPWDSWTETADLPSGKSSMTYTVAAITDSTILLDFTGNSVSVTKAMVMGNETSTTMNNKMSGKITIDKKTGIIRNKITTIESNGSTDVMGTALPVTSKSTIEITVK